MSDRLNEIKERLEKAKPKYKNVMPMLGSGHNLCTAVMAECQETGAIDFFADIYPDYVQGAAEFMDIGFDGHHARLEFLTHVFDDLQYLIALVESNETD